MINNLLRVNRSFVPYSYLFSRDFNFAIFAIVKNRDIKVTRTKNLAKFALVKLRFLVGNSN